MKELLEQGLGVIVIGGVAGIGILVRLVLLVYYGTLSYACKRIGRTRNKTVAYIKRDLEQRVGQSHGINNAMTYTECRLAERRAAGVRIGVWESMMQYSVLFVVLSGILVALAGAMTNCGDKFILQVLFLGGVAVGCLVLTDLLTGIREKDRRVRLCIRDYIENSGRVCGDGTETEELLPMKKKQIRKEKKQGKKTDKPQKAVTKRHGKAQEEKRRLTEELLRERRQLEARSLAEQRKKEREEDGQEQQVQAEAEAAVAMTECPEPAVSEERTVCVQKEQTMCVQEEQTMCVQEEEKGKVKEKGQVSREASYEMLFREVLAEYLA